MQSSQPDLAPDGTAKTNSTGELNPPKVNESGSPTQRAVTSASQAHSIAKALRDRALTGRIRTAAIIAGKYNGDPPFTGLSTTGQGWRNNFSTNFLASIVDRVKPQLTDPINATDLLTHSALPASVEDGARKSRLFCEVVTKVIRAWPEWKDFLSRLAQDVILYGHAAPARIDDDWRPRLWRYDECYFPEGTGQHACKVQVAVFQQKFLLHEFLPLFKDKDIAKKAGYSVEGCVKAANAAATTGQKLEETDLQKQDAIREGNAFADSYDTGQSRTVDVFHVLVRDYTGEIDLWTVTQADGTEIRNVEGLHERIEDGVTLFTMQAGNGKYYGSKGLGRLLTNLHIAIERGRCLGADQMYLSGLVIYVDDANDVGRAQTKVRHPFLIIGSGAKVIPEQVSFSSEAFEAMDAKLVGIAESIAGAFIPPNIEQTGSSKTKIEAAQKAEREAAVKHGVLARLFDNVSDLTGMMQRGIFSPVNLREGKRAYDAKVEKKQKGIRVIVRKVWKLLKAALKETEGLEPTSANNVGDEEAVAAVCELLEGGLTVEEIATLALTPSTNNNAEEGAGRDNATLQFIANQRATGASAFIDQRKATETEAKILLGEDRAKQLLIPQDDPNVANAAIRQQLIEASEMLDGVPMPVVGSDNHAIHRQVVAQKLQEIMPAIEQAPTPALVTTAELMMQHYMEHLGMDQTTNPEQLKQEAAALQDMWRALDAKKQELAAAPQDPNQPVPVNGQPVQAQPNGDIAGEDQNIRETMLGAADIDLRSRQADQRDAEIALRADQQKHQQEVDALKLQQKNVEMVARAAEAERKAKEPAGTVAE